MKVKESSGKSSSTMVRSQGARTDWCDRRCGMVVMKMVQMVQVVSGRWEWVELGAGQCCVVVGDNFRRACFEVGFVQKNRTWRHERLQTYLGAKVDAF